MYVKKLRLNIDFVCVCVCKFIRQILELYETR